MQYLKKFLISFIIVSNLLFATMKADESYNEDYSAQLDNNNKSTSFKFLGFGFGPALLINLDSKDPAYHVVVTSEFDINSKFSATGDFNVIFDERGNTIIDASMGIRTFFGTSDIVPFVGGNLGLGATSGSKTSFVKTSQTQIITKNVFGFTLSAIAGVQFFRAADVHFDAILKYKTLVKNNNKGLPAAFSLMVNLSTSV